MRSKGQCSFAGGRRASGRGAVALKTSPKQTRATNKCLKGHGLSIPRGPESVLESICKGSTTVGGNAPREVIPPPLFETLARESAALLDSDEERDAAARAPPPALLVLLVGLLLLVVLEVGLLEVDVGLLVLEVGLLLVVVLEVGLLLFDGGGFVTVRASVPSSTLRPLCTAVLIAFQRIRRWRWESGGQVELLLRPMCRTR